MAEDNTPTNVVDDIPDNIQKLIDEGKVIQTKTGNSTFKTLNRPTLLIDDKNISTNTYKELMNFADKNNYTLVVALERITEDSGYVTSEPGPMNKDELYKFWTRNGNEYFNWDLTYDNKNGIEKLWNDDKYVLEFYEPNQQAVIKFQDEIRNKYPELEQNRKAFTLEMYPYKTYDTNGNPVLMLREINLKPEFQGKGIGTKIMNELIEFADRLNIPILLSTSPTGKETLPEFYNRFGFIETGETGSNFENEKFMIRQPNELSGKVGRIGEVGGTEYKSYEEALEAVKNTDTPTNVVDTVGEKGIKTKTFLDDLPLIQHPETFEGEEIIDKLMERPSGQTVEEFITENNLTQREIDIINNNFDEARRIEDYLEIKKGVSPEELRISIENVGQKTPNQIVTRYIDDAYKTFDKVNFPNTALKEQALLRLNKRLLITLGTVKEWIYDPKGGGAVMGEGTKLNEYLLNVQEIFPTEQIDPAGNLINTEQQILDELGVKQLGEGSYWDNVIRGVVINAQEDLTIEGEVIPNTPQLETPTQALDELDDAISKADGIDNLNKAKDIINKNPGVFKKIFSVLEKADIGDQVITKAIIPKVLPRIGLAAATGPVGMAYAAYEIALLLYDVGQASYKAQTTDESFWDNFGEVSDKYSIAYKISKPVYDIILDNLNNDLTEEEDEEILFSFNR